MKAPRPVRTRHHRHLARGQRPQETARGPSSMRDTGSQNETNGPEDSPERPAASYTPEQRRMLRQGLRIWARVAIRSYMRKHPAGSARPKALTDNDGGEES